MKKLSDISIRKIYIIFAIVGALSFGVYFALNAVNFLLVHADKNNNKPKDIATTFIKAAQTGDYKLAAKQWTKKSVNAFENNSAYNYSFNSFCDYFKNMPDYKITKAGTTRGGYCWLRIINRSENKRIYKGYLFYLEKLNNEWFLTRDSGLLFSGRSAEEEKYGTLNILPAYSEFVENDKEIGGPKIKKIISIHRIDHLEVKLYLNHLDEFVQTSFRIKPGIHEIVYMEVVGDPADQQITFVTKKVNILEKCTYILDGYSIIKSSCEENVTGSPIKR